MFIKLGVYLAAVIGAFIVLVQVVTQSPEGHTQSPLATPKPTPVKIFPVVPIGPGRVLKNVSVVRSDSDGFVVSCSEGTFKIWNRQIPPDLYSRMKLAAPAATPFERSRSLLDAPSPPPKEKPTPSGTLDTLKELMK